MTELRHNPAGRAGAIAGMWASASPWPSPRELLLLRAALLDGDAALDSWRGFRATGRGIDQLSYDEYRVLPALSRKLRALDPDDPALGRIAGTYRHAWCANQQLLYAAANAVSALMSDGIDVILLKGAALVAIYFRDIGVRPMDDVDILVRPADAARAFEILCARGWEARGRHSVAQLMRIHHEISLIGPGRGSIDLHWSALAPRSCDTHLWDDRIPVSLRGVETWAPSPTDQLVLACAHGVGWNPAPLRWITDAMLILSASGEGIDWDDLVERSLARHVTLDVAAALEFLGREFSPPLPDGIVDELRRCPVSTSERLLHRVKVDPLRRVPLWRFIWRIARRMDAAQRLAAAPPIADGRPAGMLDFLREDWMLPTRRATVVRAAREGIGWFRQTGP